MKAGMKKLSLAVVALACLVSAAGTAEKTTVEILGKGLAGTEVYIRGSRAGVIKDKMGELGHFSAAIQPGKSLIEIKKDGQTVWSKEIQVEKGSDHCLEANLEGSAGKAPSYNEAIYWRYNLAEALRLAAQEKKPLMVDFYAPWCGWCKKLDSDIYTDPDVRKLAARLIAVKIDTDQYKAEAERYRVSGLPTIVFLDSGGNEVQRIVGYQPKEAFCQMMDVVIRLKNGSSTAAATAPASAAAPADTATAYSGFKNVMKKIVSALDRWSK